MQRFLKGLLALPILVASAAAAEAASVGVTTGTAFIPDDATVEDFTTYTPSSAIGTFSPGIGIATTDLAGQHVMPFSVDTGTYAFVSAGESPVTLSLTGSVSYFGLLWGTVDSYNTISFYTDHGATLVASFTGSDVLAGADGTATIYANFWAAAGTTFDTVVFTTTAEAFEFDNVRVAVTPLPAALGLFGSAILGLGVVRVRRRRA